MWVSKMGPSRKIQSYVTQFELEGIFEADVGIKVIGKFTLTILVWVVGGGWLDKTNTS